MKTIVVPTDFSAPAANAATYAMFIAGMIKADVKLCHAFTIPTEAFIADTVVWPLQNHDDIKTGIDQELTTVAADLADYHQKHTDVHRYQPKVTGTSAIGDTTDVIRTLAADADHPLVVMGMSGAGVVERFLFGSTTAKMIDATEGPLLVVPAHFFFHGIHRIAFATDLRSQDIQTICSLASFAKHFNADILLCHISDEKYETGERGMFIDTFLSQISDKVNYGRIYYRHVKAIDVPHGLDWIYEHSMVDMLAISHGHHSFLDEVLGSGSFTKKLAKHINIPLLVYPKDVRSASLVAF
ncbi:universal stress protein [Mucilaginibacter myungsuensis]|uniref:Universal stress protein n=1 Tax=Mucilaginibacter myungsuensis TaxID=649104 RepID=A0A929KUH0_9SPHI|nr:universal stress protein [Mucilaginibacter myungsuensis]MBE9661407.1 universal stress protein [Mucilaginibacter myungsuensis]MDN3597550.1 universal stress protein [Mucilaginibacter myungsuensis]